MRNYNEPQIIRNVFTPEECQQIIDTCEQYQFTDGTIYREQADGSFKSEVDHSVRKAENLLFPEEPHSDFDWIRERMRAASRKINEEYFEFDLTDKYYDRLVCAHYPLGGHFGPHVDNLGDQATMFKKLSCVVQLSDPDTYDGGVLRFAPEITENVRARGTMIAFPTYLRHMVMPVTRGERYVLINWCVSEKHFK